MRRTICTSCHDQWLVTLRDDARLAERLTVLSRRASRDGWCWQCGWPIKAGDVGGLLVGTTPVMVLAGRRGPWARTARLEAAGA